MRNIYYTLPWELDDSWLFEEVNVSLQMDATSLCTRDERSSTHQADHEREKKAYNSRKTSQKVETAGHMDALNLYTVVYTLSI